VVRPRGLGSVPPPPDRPTLTGVFRVLWVCDTFRYLLMCFSVASFFAYGIGQWQPAFLIRSFGLNTAELGLWLAIIYGVGGFLGTYFGGEVATRYGARNERRQLLMIAAAYASFSVLSALIYIAPNKYVAFVFMGLAAAGPAAAIGPLFATIQTLVPERMRAVSVALIYLFANLIGMGLGPLMVGAMSDLLRPSAGDESLRYALLAVCPGYLYCAWLLAKASKGVEHDMSARERADLALSAAEIKLPETWKPEQ
jgi:MFS transporter, Spinster family, sphingosine-1-phosphate transporter